MSECPYRNYDVGTTWDLPDGRWTIEAINPGTTLLDTTATLSHEWKPSVERPLLDVIDDVVAVGASRTPGIPELADDIAVYRFENPMSIARSLMTIEQQVAFDDHVDLLRVIDGQEPSAWTPDLRKVSGGGDRTSRIAIAAPMIGLSRETLRMDFKEYEGNSFVRVMKRLDAKISGYLVTYSAYTRLASAVIEKHIVGEPATGKGGQKTVKRAGGRSRTTVDNMIETIKAHNDRSQTPIDLPPSRAQRTIVASLMRASGLSGQAAMKNVVTKALRPAGRSQRRRGLIPGEQVEVDSTRLDVRLRDRATGKEVSAELLIAVDRATRSLLALRLVPGATTAADVAALVFSMSSPKQARTVLRDGAAWNYSWMTPEAIAHWSSTTGVETAGSYYGIPFVMVQEIICDHGMAYMARAVMSVLRRNGISLSPSRTASPWDKPHVERWFLYLRKALLMFLHGYTGGSVQDRNGEIVAALYVDEMEHLLLTFVAEIHQHRTIRGFRHPADPGRDLNPRAALEAAAREGTLLLPDFNEERVFDFLPTVFLKPDGAGFISLKGHKFSSPTTKTLRRKEGPYENGTWAFKFDAHDFRFIWFYNPVTQSYEPVENRDFGDAPRPLPERRIENARRDLARAGIPKSRVKAATRAMLLAEGIDLADDASEMRVALDRIHAERTAGLANVIPLPTAAGLDAEGFVDDSEDSDHDDADWTDTDGGGYYDDMAERA